MSLVLVGLGVSFDLTLSALEELKACDEVFIERYTLPMEDGKIRAIEHITGKKITALPRAEVESSFLVKRAKTAKIALLAGGDALTATTHVSLLMDARKAGTAVKVIHNSSIFTAAAGKAGLQIYKFGKTATLAAPKENYSPSSWFGIIKENVERGAHTLVLLDTEPKPMEAKTALELIEKAGGQASAKNSTAAAGINIIKGKKLVVLSRVGENDEKISYGEAAALTKRDLGKPPFCIIIPGKLHFLEEEFLEMFS